LSLSRRGAGRGEEGGGPTGPPQTRRGYRSRIKPSPPNDPSQREAFEALCRLEPERGQPHRRCSKRLAALRQGSRHFCSTTVRELSILPCIRRIVGYRRRDQHPVLSTQRAFQTVVGVIYEVMPECKRCMC